MKTLVSVSDLSKDDILSILKYADEFETKKTEPYGFAKGKILGLVFLQESLRTSASLKSAILRLGGGWIDFDLSYVKSGDEDLDDSVMAVAPLVDVLGMRGGPNIDIRPLSKKITTPIMNGMIGMEHSIGALWYMYAVWKKLGKLDGINVDMYGLTRYSRPAFAFYKAFSKFGVNFTEDSIIDEVGAPKELIDEIEKNGSKFSKGKLGEFIEDSDFLFIPEGLPVKGANEDYVNTFNKGFTPVNNEMLNKLKKESVFGYSMPRALTDGRLVAEKEVDNDPRLITYEAMEKSTYVNMGILRWFFSE